jgi:hypothetical protein
MTVFDIEKIEWHRRLHHEAMRDGQRCS